MSRAALVFVAVMFVAGGCARSGSEDAVAPPPSTGMAVTTAGTSTSAPPVRTSPAPSTTVPVTTTTHALPQPSGAGVDLGLAAAWAVALDDGGVLGVSEADQGADLNGDGDRDDVLAYAIVDDEVVATGLVVTSGVTPLSGGGFAVRVWEDEVGVDLNGDGDTSDAVPQLWTEAEAVLNLGVAGDVPASSGSWLWLIAYEAWEGSDLNGDGTIGDDDVAFRRGPAGEWLNTEWAVGTIVPRVDGSAIFGVFESEQGDLNRDGDVDDHIPVWWRAPGDAEVLAPDVYFIRETSDGGAYMPFAETDVDLNGDGVVSRWTLRFWHPDRVVVDLPVATVCHQPTPDGGAVFRVAEYPDYWSGADDCVAGTDRNGDGDCNDFVLARWSPALGLVDLGLSQEGWCPECSCGFMVAGDQVLVTEVEAAGSTYEEGEALPYPELFLVDGAVVRELGVTVGWGMAWAPIDEGVVLHVPERGRDLTGDGDLDDSVFHVVAFDGTITNLGLAGWTARPLSAGRALLFVDEQGQGTDLNGDGKVTADTLVVHLWRRGAGVINLGVTAAQLPDEMSGSLHTLPTPEIPGDRLVVLVPEGLHGGGDLNGDGDTDDDVAHLVTLPVPSS